MLPDYSRQFSELAARKLSAEDLRIKGMIHRCETVSGSGRDRVTRYRSDIQCGAGNIEAPVWYRLIKDLAARLGEEQLLAELTKYNEQNLGFLHTKKELEEYTLEMYSNRIFEMEGERSVVRTNSVGVFLRKKGTSAESELQLPRASLIQYTGDTLTVYAPVERDPNEQESGILAEWNQQEEELMKKNPLGDTYWKMKDFFGASSCPYMSGFESQKCQGKSYNRSTGKVRDSHIPGTMILRYNVRHLNCE